MHGVRTQGEGQDLSAFDGHALRKGAELPILRSAYKRAVVQRVLGPRAHHSKVNYFHAPWMGFSQRGTKLRHPLSIDTREATGRKLATLHVMTKCTDCFSTRDR